MNLHYDEIENEGLIMGRKQKDMKGYGIFEGTPSKNAQKLFRNAIREIQMNEFNEMGFNEDFVFGIQKKRKVD